MGMKRPRTEAYWRRRHLRGVETERVECLSWVCAHKAIDYTTGDKTCTATNSNLNYWCYVHAPNWCPKRTTSRREK